MNYNILLLRIPHIILFTLLVFVGSVSAHAKKQIPFLHGDELPHDSVFAEKWAELLLNRDICVGVFEISGMYDYHPVKTRDGILPEDSKDFFSLILKHNLLKMITVETIRCDVDSFIIMKSPPGSAHPEAGSQFYPFSDTRWILALSKAFDSKQQPASTWLKTVNPSGALKWLSPYTAFNLSSTSHGLFCLKWDESKEKPPGMKTGNDQTISELKILAAIFGNAEAAEGEYLQKLIEIEPGINDRYVKLISSELKKKLTK